MMPFLASEFGLLPWHFGGEECLTYSESNCFLEAAKNIADANKKAAQKAKTRGRGRR